MASGGFAGWLGISGTYAEWLGVWSGVASLVSLFVSSYAAWQITAVRRKVSRRVAFTALADEFLDKVGLQVAVLADLIRAYPDKRLEIVSVIRECVALLRTNKAELSRDGLAALTELQSLVSRYGKLVTATANKKNVASPEGDLDLLWQVHGAVKQCLIDYQSVVAQRRKGVVDDL